MALRDLGRVADLLSSVIPLEPRPDVTASGYDAWENRYLDRKSVLLILAQLVIDIADVGAVARSMLDE